MDTDKRSILNRTYFIFSIMILMLLFIIVRVFQIQFIQGDHYREISDNMYVKRVTIDANRGNIYANDGVLLATSVSRFEIRMDPVAVSDKLFESQIMNLSDKLSQKFGKTSSYYNQQIRYARNLNNRYLFIAKNLSYTDYLEVKQFPIFNKGVFNGGFIAEQETKREHPIGRVAQRTIGYDNYRGKVGIEGAYSHYLRGKKGYRMKQKIAKGQWRPISDNNEVEPEDGNDVITTIDVNMQDIAHYNLLKQLEKFNAEHGCVVVMETHTGEVKAISNLARVSRGNYYEKRNYAIYESHEPGSTFKLMSLVAALEHKVLDTSTVVDTGNGIYRIRGRKVEDTQRGGFGKISIAKVFEKSSNVGIVKSIDKHYRDNPYKFINKLKEMNIGEPLNLPIKGEGKPVLLHPDDNSWHPLALQWTSWGYNVSLTPLQTLTFYNAIANDGEMVKPIFVKEIRNQGQLIESFSKEVINPRICSQETINKVKKLMENVVKRGTASTIYSKDFSMAGKTGTAKKYIPVTIDAQGKKTGGYYSNLEYSSSFTGYFPADNPKYSCIVVIHNPDKSVGYYGADVAGPVFKNIAQKIYTRSSKIQIVNLEDEPIKTLYESYDSYNAKLQKKYSKIPNVKEMPGMDAVAFLENLGLNVSFQGMGKVIEQSVEPGSSLDKGDRIHLILSKR